MTQALAFLISTLFNLYFWAIIIRIILQMIRADYYNPLSQLVIKLTKLPLIIFYKILPYRKGVDFAALIFAFIIILIKVALMMLLFDLPLHPVNLLLFGVFDFIQQVLGLYFYILIVVCIASWFARASNNQVLSVLFRMVNPLLKPVRRVIPIISGFDFSPLVLIIVIIFLRLIFSNLSLGL